MTPADADANLASQRTVLAWNRSSLSLLACGAVVLKGVPRLPDPNGRPVAGAVIVALAVVASLAAAWEERARRHSFARGAGPIEASVAHRYALANAVIGLAALVLAAASG